jgi:ferredoxin
MKTSIYFFSGTGNSLAVARGVAGLLDGAVELVPMARVRERQGIEIDADVLGIVFPTYFLSIPGVAGSCLKNLEFRSNPYIFSVVTCNGQPGRSLYSVRGLLGRKGRPLSAGFTLDMPGNCLIGVDYTSPPEVREKRLEQSKREIPVIAETIRQRRVTFAGGSDTLGTCLKGLLMASFVKHVYRPARAFRAGESCTRCGTCARVCPFKNVTVDRVRGPVWGDACANCLACLHWCPNRAVEIKQDSVGRTRYHHPDVTVDQIAL